MLVMKSMNITVTKPMERQYQYDNILEKRRVLPQLNHIRHGDALAHPLRLRLLAATFHSSPTHRPSTHPSSAATHSSSSVATHHPAAITVASVPIVVLIVVVATIVAALVPFGPPIFVDLPGSEGELVGIVPPALISPGVAGLAASCLALSTGPTIVRVNQKVSYLIYFDTLIDDI